MIPLGVDRESRNPAVVTNFLVVVNVVLFVAGALATRSPDRWSDQIWTDGVFLPQWSAFVARPWSIVSYAFLHDPESVWHVAFNMLFLWVFGRAVEGRLWSVWFMAFYLGACAVSALGHALVSPAGVIGASGAVAAVTGAFATLFPRARVRVLVFFSIIEVPGLLLATLFVALDLLGTLGFTRDLGGRVAYSAHLAGYGFGLVTMILLLSTGVLPRTEFDLFFLAKQWRRRKLMRDALSSSSSPWRKDAMSVRSAPSLAQEPKPAAPSPEVAARELADASACWSRGEFAKAATLWERFAARHPAHADADGALLLAAMACLRRLNDSSRARGIVERLIARTPAPSPATLDSARALAIEIDAANAAKLP